MGDTNGKKRLGILVGGGPAPGINGVIGAATIEALNRGLEVVGILDGFKWLSKNDTSHTVTLSYPDVEQTRFRGGSMLHTSRENPTKDEQKMQNVVAALKTLGIDYLVTIGGDDTAFSASKTSQYGAGAIKVAHVPKTIDNDLPLPGNMPTFGFQTARHYGGELVRNLVNDARTTRRWYLVVAMGRTAGHLALGMGTCGDANLTIIPEELPDEGYSLDLLCDTIECAMLKTKVARGDDCGVVVVAEGVAEFCAEDLKENPLVAVKYDEHGHWRLAEVPFALILKRKLQERAEARGEKTTYVDITVGYELRCSDPISVDVQYTEQLGWGAVRYLLGIGEESYERGGAMISIQAGDIVPIPFSDILDPKTGKTSVRRVNVHSDYYRCARSFMTRLEREDLANEVSLGKLAEAAGMAPEDFRAKFGPVVGM